MSDTVYYEDIKYYLNYLSELEKFIHSESIGLSTRTYYELARETMVIKTYIEKLQLGQIKTKLAE